MDGLGSASTVPRPTPKDTGGRDWPITTNTTELDTRHQRGNNKRAHGEIGTGRRIPTDIALKQPSLTPCAVGGCCVNRARCAAMPNQRRIITITLSRWRLSGCASSAIGNTRTAKLLLWLRKPFAQLPLRHPLQFRQRLKRELLVLQLRIPPVLCECLRRRAESLLAQPEFVPASVVEQRPSL